jgi:hypothetical protein
VRIRTWRLSVILAVVAASLLLAVPAVAGAHVKAKYRAEYRAKLTSLNSGFLAFASNYDNVKQGSIDAAETMAPMIGDPDQHEQLVDQENWCLTVYNMNKGKPATWRLTYSKVINAFKGKAARYFATAAQQRAFKRGCDRLNAYGGVLIELANDHLYWSYRQLGYDPPNIDLSAQAIADGDEDAATGHEGWDKSLAALRALQ